MRLGYVTVLYAIALGASIASIGDIGVTAGCGTIVSFLD